LSTNLLRVSGRKLLSQTSSPRRAALSPLSYQIPHLFGSLLKNSNGHISLKAFREISRKVTELKSKLLVKMEKKDGLGLL
jgi:hypothetical protein